MKTLGVFAVVTLGLLAAAPAIADPLPPGGITRQEMADLMQKHGWRAQLTNNSNGVPIISSSAAGVNFDIYFYNCENDRCLDIQFAAGWSNTHIAPEKVNNWNETKRFLRVYYKPGGIVWAEMDARIEHSSTENIDEYFSLWQQLMPLFKNFMNL